VFDTSAYFNIDLPLGFELLLALKVQNAIISQSILDILNFNQ